jgi:septum formation protein
VSGLILASSSAARAQILRAAGVYFHVHPADVDETAIKAALAGKDNAQIAVFLAEAKALWTSCAYPHELVLGCDQLAVFEDRPISKSKSLDEAAQLLRRLRGHTHRLLSAAVLARDGAILWRTMQESVLKMRDFSDEFLENYLQAEGEDLLGSVGCYRLEGLGAHLFESIEGDYFAVLGLPLLPLLAALRTEGVVAA